MESNTSTMLGSLVKNILKYTTSQLVHMEYVDFEMNHICQVEANYWDTFKCHIHYKYSVLFDGKKTKNIEFILLCISRETRVKQYSKIR